VVSIVVQWAEPVWEQVLVWAKAVFSGEVLKFRTIRFYSV
jgi:hypothetical protein